MKKKVYGLGRSRSSKGEWIGIHLNPYVNCIHTLCMGGFETMAILIVEVYEDYNEGGGNHEPLKATDMGKKIIQQPRGYNMGGLFDNCPTITGSSFEENNFIVDEETLGELNLPPELIGKPVHVRKMTPRELFRFMDVDDADIDKIEGIGLSKSAMGKLAGNSICVGVLYHIFRKMFIETEADLEEGDQLSLF